MGTKHPADVVSPLDKVAAETMDKIMGMDPRLLTVERKKALLSAKLSSLKLAASEKELHGGMDPCVQRVVEGKNLLLWKSLLQKHNYDDMGVVDFMTKGVPLVGMHETPNCFPLKLVPAKVSEQELRNSALWRRKSLLAKEKSTSKPEHFHHLEETAREERAGSFIEGPFRKGSVGLPWP